ncbi:MAG: alpha/beta hydrolase [Dehalococcoidia bacterium]|nr:alpha/beta hydrolase [Dehalococcoidia bacterium]
MPIVRVNGIDLFYQQDDFCDPWAAHDTVFIQHGFCRNSNFWYAWVPWLARHFRVIRMDLRGCGRSGDPGPDYKFTGPGFISDFTGFLDAVKVDRVHYIGEALGGIIGVASAVAHPERFKSLTIVGGAIQKVTGNPLMGRAGYSSWEETVQDVKANGMKHWWMKSRGRAGELTGNAAMDDYFASEFARTPVHVALALSQAAPTIDNTKALTQLSVPTLILSRTQQGLIPGAREMVYPEASSVGAAAFYLMADRLAQDTAAFLQEISR